MNAQTPPRARPTMVPPLEVSVPSEVDVVKTDGADVVVHQVDESVDELELDVRLDALVDEAVVVDVGPGPQDQV